MISREAQNYNIPQMGKLIWTWCMCSITKAHNTFSMLFSLRKLWCILHCLANADTRKKKYSVDGHWTLFRGNRRMAAVSVVIIAFLTLLIGKIKLQKAKVIVLNIHQHNSFIYVVWVLINFLPIVLTTQKLDKCYEKNILEWEHRGESMKGNDIEISEYWWEQLWNRIR